MIPSNSLGILMAYLKDWYFGHHDALEDSWAGVHLCSMYLEDLITKCYTPQFNVMANKSDFEAKDALKYRGYRWNAEEKVWFKPNVDESEADEELKWLETYCHGKQEKIPIDIKARHL
jgi:DNA polymerase-3 subunit epsilon